MSEVKKVPEIRFAGFAEPWEQRKFGDDLNSIQTGTNKLGSPENAGMPLLKMGNIQRGYFSLDKLEYLIEGDEAEPENIAQNGDFFFNTRNTLELVGKGATWFGESGKYAFNSNIARFDLGEIDTVFFNYLYNTEQMQKQVHARAMGTTSVAAIYPRTLDSIEYSLPSKEEQRKIGKYMYSLDNLLTLHQRKHDKLAVLKKAMLEKMFPQDGNNVPEVRFAGFTGPWEQRKLGDIGETYTGLSGKTKEDFGHGQARFVTYMNVFSNPISNPEMTEPIEIDPKQNEVEVGDVFFTTSSETPEEVGVSSVLLEKRGKTYLNSFCFGFRPSEKIDSYYLAYMLRSESAREKIILLAQGISRYNISKNKVMEIAVSLPSLDEQKLIGQYFRQLDNLITLHQRKCESLKHIKAALLQKMFV